MLPCLCHKITGFEWRSQAAEHVLSSFYQDLLPIPIFMLLLLTGGIPAAVEENQSSVPVGMRLEHLPSLFLPRCW